MLSVIMQSVLYGDIAIKSVMHSVFMLIVIMLSVIMLSVIMLGVIMPNVIILSDLEFTLLSQVPPSFLAKVGQD